MSLPVPEAPIRGSQAARDRIIKELWIQAKGGKCFRCSAVYCPRVVFSRSKFGRRYRKLMSNLQFHYTGPDRPNHKKFRLGRLAVPTPNRPNRQKEYLKKWSQELQHCSLLCGHCHGELHGQESGKRQNTGCLNSYATNCVHPSILSARLWPSLPAVNEQAYYQQV